MILVAEELGVGLGARYAGIDGPDPGPYLNVEKPPQAKVLAAGRPTPSGTSPAPPTTVPSSRARHAGCGSGRSSGPSRRACSCTTNWS